MENDKYEMCLFIGGPKDGEMIGVAKDHHQYVTFADAPNPLDPSDTFRQVFYRPMKWAGGKNRYTLYVIDGMNGDEVMEALISRYAKIKYSELRTLRGVGE